MINNKIQKQNNKKINYNNKKKTSMNKLVNQFPSYERNKWYYLS